MVDALRHAVIRAEVVIGVEMIHSQTRLDIHVNASKSIHQVHDRREVHLRGVVDVHTQKVFNGFLRRLGSMQTGMRQLVLRTVLAARIFFANRRHIVVTGNGCQKHCLGHGVDCRQHVHVTAAAFRKAIPGIHTGDQHREGVLRDVIHRICRGLVFRLVGIGVHNLRICPEVLELLVLQVIDVPAIGIIQNNRRHFLVIETVHHSLNVVILLVLERHTFARQVLNQCLGAGQGDAFQRSHRLALQILLRSDTAVLQRNHLYCCRGFVPEICHIAQQTGGFGNIVSPRSIHQDHHHCNGGQDDFRSRAPGES